jgi:DNA polymerase-3 subunit delta
MFADLPDYVCVIFIYDTVPYKPDGRTKLDKEILKLAQVIEFTVREQSQLVKWIMRHFKDAGKHISHSDAEYLVLITGGYMTVLHGEIGKTAAYASAETVTRSDIDAVVTPILDAVVYKLADALVKREHTAAMRILDELLRMREAPDRLLYNISLKMRQLLAARACIEGNMGKSTLIEICGIRHEFQAKMLMDTARSATLAGCRDAVLLCSETAYDLRGAPEPESQLIELVAKLALRQM